METRELRQLCQSYIARKAPVIPEHVSKELLGRYDIPTPAGLFAPTAAEAPAAAARLGYPVALKAVSTTLLHKTEWQAVRLNIADDSSLTGACRDMEERFSRSGEALLGFLVETMAPGGTEFIVGLQNDPQFGPVVMLGTGGTLIHLLDDVTFRPLPVSRGDIVAMIDEIKGRQLIDGHRGRRPLNAEALIRTIAAVARFGCDAAGLYQSVDLNPVVVDAHTAMALDAKIVLAGSAGDASLDSQPPRTDNLEQFFQPQRVALLGASTTPGKIGYAVADSLINHEYKGTVYPVTLGGKDVFGLTSYPRLEDIPSAVDLVVVVVGLTMVPAILDECKRLGIAAILIISGGGYRVCKGAFNQAGILAVDSFEELVAASKALSLQPPARGSAVGMISNGAGPMVNAMDLFDRYGLAMATVSADNIEKMEAHFPSFYICKNPVDVTGSATSADYLYAMELLVDDPGVDIIMNWFVFQDTPLDEGIVEALARIQRRSEKPILCGASGGPYTRKLALAIEKVGVPVFESAHLWAAAARTLVGWGREITKRSRER